MGIIRMNQQSNGDKLRALKLKHGLTSQKVAGILKVSIGSVNSWLTNPESETSTNMPDNQLKLLIYILNDKNQEIA